MFNGLDAVGNFSIVHDEAEPLVPGIDIPGWYAACGNVQHGTANVFTHAVERIVVAHRLLHDVAIGIGERHGLELRDEYILQQIAACKGIVAYLSGSPGNPYGTDVALVEGKCADADRSEEHTMRTTSKF